MYYVYVLRSKGNGKRYVGFTGKSPDQRLLEHNEGKNQSTRSNRPYDLIYFEQHESEEFARKRERYFKTGHGRAYLNRMFLEV
ncbi:MAG: GIY-YIG nuclease family protein [Candidatus Omnitrophica bacterium]|nr:GIY-YIG nuclease family protein [Candidatus Omnitrophota bacterium]MDE2222759.1 GIY-YIG nuclease family protein [Candidatus Omnitrophota bacterium]